jgi:ribosome-interacting GTPase 1
MYTTKDPTPGMFSYEDLQFQILEAPALMEGSADGGTWGLKALTVARNADGLILMIDLSNDPISQISMIFQELEKAKILIRKPKARIEIEREYRGSGLKIVILGHLINCTPHDVERFLKSYGINDGTIKIRGEASIDDIEDAILEGAVYRPAFIVANKFDIQKAKEQIDPLKEFVGNEILILPISCKNKIGLEEIGHILFKMLNIMRIYTKEPHNKQPSNKPFIIRSGSTIFDMAKTIHSDFYKNFSYAKIWSKRLRFNPQRVGGNFSLEDGDIVEIHLK